MRAALSARGSSLAACAQRDRAGLGERRRHRASRYGDVCSPPSTSSWRGGCSSAIPGLTIVGVFGMAVGMAISAGAFTIVGRS